MLSLSGFFHDFDSLNSFTEIDFTEISFGEYYNSRLKLELVPINNQNRSRLPI